MASGNAPTSSEYVVHHLTNLNQTGHAQKDIIDWSMINIDSVFWSFGLGFLTVFLLWRAAAKATSGRPGRFQAAVEILVEMVADQAKGVIAWLPTWKQMPKASATWRVAWSSGAASARSTPNLAARLSSE